MAVVASDQRRRDNLSDCGFVGAPLAAPFFGQGKLASTQLSAGPSTGLRTGFDRLRLRTLSLSKWDRPFDRLRTGPAPTGLFVIGNAEIRILQFFKTVSSLRPAG